MCGIAGIAGLSQIAHARLSIIDLEGGGAPVHSKDRSAKAPLKALGCR